MRWRKPQRFRTLGEPRASQASQACRKQPQANRFARWHLALCFLCVCLDLQASNTKLHGVPRSLINRKSRHSLLFPLSLTFYPASMAHLRYAILQLVFYAAFLFHTSKAFTIRLHGPSDIASPRHHSSVKRQSGGLQLNNTHDISYYADIMLGNQTFTVLVDTGRYVCRCSYSAYSYWLSAPTFGWRDLSLAATTRGSMRPLIMQLIL